MQEEEATSHKKKKNKKRRNIQVNYRHIIVQLQSIKAFVLGCFPPLPAALVPQGRLTASSPFHQPAPSAWGGQRVRISTVISRPATVSLPTLSLEGDWGALGPLCYATLRQATTAMLPLPHGFISKVRWETRERWRQRERHEETRGAVLHYPKT